MSIRIFIIFLFFSCVFHANAQPLPGAVKRNAWNMHALRYYPFTQNADSIVKQVIAQNLADESKKDYLYQKTAVDFVINEQYLTEQFNFWANISPFIYKNVINPYQSWFSYAPPIEEKPSDLDMTLFLSEKQTHLEKGEDFSQAASLLSPAETENIQTFLTEYLGEINIFEAKSEVLFRQAKNPLGKDAMRTYRYFLSSMVETAGIPSYEIAFFSKNVKEESFEGYLYISQADLKLLKAVFTLNYRSGQESGPEVVFTQTPERKEIRLYLGDDIKKSLMISRIEIQNFQPADAYPPEPLTLSQTRFPELRLTASQTPAFRNTEKMLSFLLTNRIGIVGNKLELGPVTQMVSYNPTEGIRLRISGNTAQIFGKHWKTGGYLAYGIHDKRLKYRGDIAYSFHPGHKLQVTYVTDLNLPGYELLSDKRDDFFSSFYHAGAKNISWKKVGNLYYERFFKNRFSIKGGAKFWSDRPLENLKYSTVNQGTETIINAISSLELGVSFRYAPGERNVRFHDKDLVLRESDLVLEMNHRTGIKGVYGSDYNYQITDASAFKRFDFPSDRGSLGIQFSGGKVWNQLPFPLLFIPAGNQSFIFDAESYNLMRFYEFVTDRYLAGNLGLQFKWSPVNFVLPRNKIRTNLGIKAIYGPLSADNNPDLHQRLFVFNNSVNVLGNRPYIEAHIGLSHIFNFLRVDYVRRLTYGNKGAIFFSTDLTLN
ncbi:MAG: DUF5686 family protein [Dysgonamonadaceae bacterium]|jgi:hypothetical protein|nr:DUF5686 family protein [Dysgonamonadaceae bacterium]